MRRTPAWFGYLVSIALVATATLIIGLVIAGGPSPIANTSMLYLVVVLISALLYGRGPAILASVLSVLAFNWFFVEPVHQLAIADPNGYLALALFLLVAVVTGTLATVHRDRAEEADARRREASVLYEVVRDLGGDDLRTGVETALSRLRGELGLAAVAFEPADREDDSIAVAVGDNETIRQLRAGGRTSAELLGATPPGAQGARGRWVRIVQPHTPASRSRLDARLHAVPVGHAKGRVGTLLFVRARGAPRFHPADERLVAAAAAQLASGIERARLRHEATEAELLRRTDELKTALLNAVSHDLRTPLASILAAAGSLRQRDVAWSDEQREDLLESIEQEARRLDRLVGNLLDLSRIEAGTLAPQKAWYDLGALVEDVVGRLRPVTAAHRVNVRVPEDLPPVLLDYAEIDQVLTNLIENATKFAPAGTDIEISAALDGGMVRVEVADRGPGIPPADRPGIFAPFQRLSRDLRMKGSGLGLAIARRLVEAHGGSIGVEPRSGGGSRFVFTLPR